MKIDEIDKQILNELMKDGRISMKELGTKINMSSPAVRERVKQMESYGIIKNYTVAIDLTKVGYPVSCLIEATVKHGEYSRFKLCHRIAGRACFMIKAYMEDLSKVEAFIEQLSPFAETVTHVVLSTLNTDMTLT
ncbi:Lrp/AsnC family transcriptional regulator [Halalkalibacterium halodurans]|uniref:Lrp/AsnC family transcriptional regulator n=1 Tax=Halalkalibacterium halodurans TaxID=86665 RepID=UPI001067A5D4|nr:Lrp/AsnC family transcriptional regulator [Halalkalibacterium halodurans]TES51802.1 Lrp/AsnC family transcriptional regulator [Halalkalibacterium halodurans]